MVADRKLSEAELFQVVGAGWKQYESEKRKKTFREKLKAGDKIGLYEKFGVVRDRERFMGPGACAVEIFSA